MIGFAALVLMAAATDSTAPAIEADGEHITITATTVMLRREGPRKSISVCILCMRLVTRTCTCTCPGGSKRISIAPKHRFPVRLFWWGRAEQPRPRGLITRGTSRSKHFTRPCVCVGGVRRRGGESSVASPVMTSADLDGAIEGAVVGCTDGIEEERRERADGMATLAQTLERARESSTFWHPSASRDRRRRRR